MKNGDIVNLNVFTNIILACIVFSSITLAIEDPIDEHRDGIKAGYFK